MNKELVAVGELVRDGLGHWLRVVEIVWQAPGAGHLIVQPLTWSGTVLVPLGAPVRAFRSDLRKDGE